MPQPVLDLRKYHWRRDHAGISFIGTWYRNEDRRHRPCMVLIRAGDERNRACQPYIIPLERAWIYEETIGDGAQAARGLIEMAKSLRMEPDPAGLRELHGYIASHLGDLATIPPYRHDNEHVADIFMRNRETGKLIEVELRGDV